MLLAHPRPTPDLRACLPAAHPTHQCPTRHPRTRSQRRTPPSHGPRKGATAGRGPRTATTRRAPRVRATRTPRGTRTSSPRPPRAIAGFRAARIVGSRVSSVRLGPGAGRLAGTARGGRTGPELRRVSSTPHETVRARLGEYRCRRRRAVRSWKLVRGSPLVLAARSRRPPARTRTRRAPDDPLTLSSLARRRDALLPHVPLRVLSDARRGGSSPFRPDPDRQRLTA